MPEPRHQGMAASGGASVEGGGRPDPDAPRESPGLSYMPALDGLRAFAVLSVMAYHGGISWLPGGFLGVDTFFVLSGFLITSLLITEWDRIRTIRLGAFWARRARRLLPCLLLVLLLVAAFAAFAVPPGTYPGLRLDALSTLFYVANWHFILVGSSYFNQAALPSPLTHTWSLAIEEQFYLVWPVVVLLVLRFTRGLRVLAWVCVVGAVASAAEMALLSVDGANPTRLYYGTDTHAQCLLVGAALAVGLATVAARRRAAGSAPAGDPAANPWWAVPARLVPLVTGAGLTGAAVTAVLWWRTNGNGAFVYRGGFLIASLSTAAVLVSVVCLPSGWLARALSVAPIRFLGRISYGLYLWHYPLFIWIDHQRTGLSGYLLFADRVVVTVLAATLSFYLVERPIRQGTFFRDWRAWAITPLAAVGVVACLLAATVTPAVAVDLKRPPGGDPSLYLGPPVKVLVVGDSTALTLGLGLSVQTIVQAYDVQEFNEGILGCGVAEGPTIQLKGVDEGVNAPCETTTPADQQWPADWQRWVDQYQPNVVMLLAGRWEVLNRVYDGQWTNILQPAFQAYVRAQLQKAVDIATDRGARMVILTAPCYDSGEQPNGQPWPEDELARVIEYNDLVRQVAAANPTKVSVLNLYAEVCPGGHFTTDLNGIPVRAADGVHFTVAGGEYLAPFVWPPIVKVGREQMAAATGQPSTTTSSAAP